MPNRFPLIVNSSSRQIQELAAGDNLDLTSSSIVGVASVTATNFYGDGSTLSNVPTGAGFGTAMTGYTGVFSYYNNEYTLNANLTINNTVVGAGSSRAWSIYETIVVGNTFSLVVDPGYQLTINPAGC